jgi:hypothetical protein
MTLICLDDLLELYAVERVDNRGTLLAEQIDEQRLAGTTRAPCSGGSR